MQKYFYKLCRNLLFISIKKKRHKREVSYTSFLLKLVSLGSKTIASRKYIIIAISKLNQGQHRPNTLLRFCFLNNFLKRNLI